MAKDRRLAAAGLTPLQIEFCHLYALGPNAGNGTKSVREAGYKVESDEAAAAMASELLTRPDVRMYLGLLYAERRAGRIIQSRPWDALLPSAQALQMEVIEAARDAVASMRFAEERERPAPSPEALLGPEGFTANPPDPDGAEEEEGQGLPDPERPGLNPKLVTGPLVHLIKAGLEAAEIIEAYSLGKPVTRAEQGDPGAFKEQGLRETVAEIRESMELFEAAGMAGLLTTGTEELPVPILQKRVSAGKGKKKGKKKGNKKRKQKENALEAPECTPSPAPKRKERDKDAGESNEGA